MGGWNTPDIGGVDGGGGAGRGVQAFQFAAMVVVMVEELVSAPLFNLLRVAIVVVIEEEVEVKDVEVVDLEVVQAKMILRP